MNKHLTKIIAQTLCLLMLLAVCAGCGDTSNPTENPTASPSPTVPTQNGSVPFEEPALTGSWIYDGSGEYMYTFNKDGTGSYTFGDQEQTFDFTDHGDYVVIQYRNVTEPNTFHYSVKGTVLSIEDSFGQYVTYLKAENGIPLSPFSEFHVDFSPEKTAAMSTYMNYGYYTVCGDTVYGLGHDSKGNEQFVQFNLKQVGDFAEISSSKIIERKVSANYITAYGEDIYYIRNWQALYKVSQNGGTPECIINSPIDYFQIVNDTMYFCDENYYLCKANLDGSNLEVVISKEMYYPYFLDEDWLIYQDDADGESLHLYHMLTGSDIAISDAVSYHPIIAGSTVYFIVMQDGFKTLARTDLNQINITYDESSQKYFHSFDIETTGNHVYSEIAINFDGYCYNGRDEGYSLDYWTRIDNPDDVLERLYRYSGEDYNIFWEYNDKELVSNIYVTRNETGGSAPIKRFD